MSRRAKRYSRHYKSRHHLRPRSRNGSDLDSNLLILWRNKHDAWHLLFGNRTLGEIINVLNRMKEAKHYKE